MEEIKKIGRLTMDINNAIRKSVEFDKLEVKDIIETLEMMAQYYKDEYKKQKL